MTNETNKQSDAEARIAMLEATLKGIAEANFREWDDGLNTAEEFVRWAQSRARYVLTPNAPLTVAATGGTDEHR